MPYLKEEWITALSSPEDGERAAAAKRIYDLGRSLAEIFDGDAPHHPRGCIAQAWTVGEILRVWKEIQASPIP